MNTDNKDEIGYLSPKNATVNLTFAGLISLVIALLASVTVYIDVISTISEHQYRLEETDHQLNRIEQRVNEIYFWKLREQGNEETSSRDSIFDESIYLYNRSTMFPSDDLELH